mmetsp:Transcript_13971/g.33881  ORF Transcript_13971/g.33881 Transcript_13971/m.33881 type:complete len:84 (-) Transcript_13971:589-840(-)
MFEAPISKMSPECWYRVLDCTDNTFADFIGPFWGNSEKSKSTVFQSSFSRRQSGSRFLDCIPRLLKLQQSVLQLNIVLYPESQ